MFDRNYIMPLRPATQSPWAYQLDYFSASECDSIIQHGKLITAQDGNLGDGSVVNNQIRSSRVGFFDPKQAETAWIFDRIRSAAVNINQQFWNFDLDFIECIQFTRYDRPGDFYAAHQDLRYLPLEMRKLSISVQLSDPDTYQGSDLRMFRYGQEFDCVPRSKGCIIVFPSYHAHEVTPLISGARYSLVSWIVGKPFR